MYGAAVRCKRFSSIWLLRSCINVSGLCLERFVLRAIMDISAHAFSLADRPQERPSGSPGFACAGKTDPPSLLNLSQTSGVKRDAVLRHCCFLVGTVPLFVPRGRSFVPACGWQGAPRAGAVKAGRSTRPPEGLGLG